GARATKIPIYMIRTSYNKGLGAVLPEDIWKPAIEATGGKFYPAGDEAAVLNAIKDIDRRSAGRVDIKRYGSQQPKFSGYAAVAPQKDANGVVTETDPAILFLSANAAFRGTQNVDRLIAVRRLDDVVRSYAEVLKTQAKDCEPGTRACEARATDAAYNYEY